MDTACMSLSSNILHIYVMIFTSLVYGGVISVGLDIISPDGCHRNMSLVSPIVIMITFIPRQNVRHFADDILKPLFLYEKCCILITIWLNMLQLPITHYRLGTNKRQATAHCVNQWMPNIYIYIYICIWVCVIRPRWPIVNIQINSCLMYDKSTNPRNPRPEIFYVALVCVGAAIWSYPPWQTFSCR